jgi:TolA-binding protein
MADATYLVPRKSLQPNLPSHSKRIIEKSPKASSNETEAQYESETTIKASRNNDEESAVADDMPVEPASNPHQSPFLSAKTDPVKFIGSEDLERGKGLFIDRKYSEAEQVFRQIVRGREKALGKEDKETLESKHWLAYTLRMQGQYQEAEVVFRKVVRGREKVLGKEAVESLNSKYWLAQTLYLQGQDQEAEVVFREVLRGREKVLGKEAVESLDSKYWLARTLYEQKQYQNAEVVFREVLQGEEKVLGKEAVETLNSKFWLAWTLYRQK